LNNDIKQRAEQLRKNAEAKIQQAQIKEQKYQQWLENQKQNNPNFRDYDENPIVIKDYKPQVNLIGIFLMILAFIILCIAKPEKVNGFTILSLMVAIPYIMKFLGKNYFILKNEMISQIKNDKSFDFMQVKNIKNVKFSVDFRDGSEQISLVAKILILIIISTYIYAIFAFNALLLALISLYCWINSDLFPITSPIILRYQNLDYS